MFPATRAEALARLAEFVPHAGRRYAAGRNDDHGPGGHEAVSRLSAALRRRLIAEPEVLQAVLGQHGPAAEKFVSEVFWRTYFKGWLEHRPAVWAGWREDVARLRPEWAGRVAEAEAGRTGIDAFDHWMGELRATGYLHNWARMQVASIWTFTLGLPWQLGADLTFRHFIDADPASNTLSWRWVAGLHTPGRTYLASAERIARRTGGRFRPAGLATRAVPADGMANPEATALPEPPAPDPAVACVLLVTEEDLSPEIAWPELDVRHLLVQRGPPGDGPAASLSRRALADAACRAAAHWQCPAEVLELADVAARLASLATLQPVTAALPTGPVADALAGAGIGQLGRAWDRAAWPHATRGFFQLRRAIPGLLETIDGRIGFD